LHICCERMSLHASAVAPASHSRSDWSAASFDARVTPDAYHQAMRQLLVLASASDLDAVGLHLRTAGWSTRRIRRTTPHLIIPARRPSVAREVFLADVDPLTAAEQVRAIRCSSAGSRIRIMLAAARPNDAVLQQAILRALQKGADDFVNAAVLHTELGLRLEALVQRDQQRESRRVLTVYGMKFHGGTGRLQHGERSVILTRSECRVLLCLASHAGTPVSRALIRQRLGRGSKAGGGNFVDVLVLYLRRKLAELRGPCDIRTVRRVGYVLTAELTKQSDLAPFASSRQDECVTAM